MKKLIILSITLFAIVACGNATQEMEKEIAEIETQPEKEAVKEDINGVWVPVKQEFSGAVIPQAAFAAQELTLADSTYKMVAEGVDEGIIKYADGKMDIYGKQGPNKGKHIMAIYKMENGNLCICYNLLGDSYPENYATRGKQMCFMSEFRKK